jgi:outer membrane immunogenic protein
MTKRLVLSAVLTCFVAGSAAAADMPTKAAPYRNYQPGAYSWNGFYVGGVVGAGIVTPQFSDLDAFFTDGNWQAGAWSGTAGLTAGYNVQYGAAVFGIEADINWTSFDRSLSNPDFGSQFSAKWDWFSTVRGRFGLAFDRALIYATAGIAIVNQDYLVSYPSDGCEYDVCAKHKKTEVGLALGAGAEYALGNNWSFKAEYLFIKLPTKEVNDFAKDDDAAFQFTTDAHFARIGLNYRFGY